MRNNFLLIALVFFTLSCTKPDPYVVADFDPLSNYSSSHDTITLDMDLSNAITRGISIPSDTAKSKYFHFRFKIKNQSREAKKYYYKLYYQNESYKFNEFVIDTNNIKRYNPRASQNFYGSWHDTDPGFHETEFCSPEKGFYEILDSIRIVGNPRNEDKYFGDPLQNKFISETELNTTAERIRNTADWLTQIEDKATQNGISVSDQIDLDARWIILYDRNNDLNNFRWKRNPRVGTYSFLLVVAEEGELNRIPDFIQDISVKDTISGDYHNPYHYFLHQPKKLLPKIQVLKSDKYLSLSAKLEPEKGIFIDSLKFTKKIADPNFNQKCGIDEEHFLNAQFEQYFHHINYDYKLENIPKAVDVVNDNYTQAQYRKDSIQYSAEGRIEDHVKITESPGKSVGFDSGQDAIFIKNPGSHGDQEYRKENVGVNTRIGFTYGKFRAKIRFPKIISDDFVWNGLTCAFWLCYQADEKWNERGACKEGYIPKNSPGKEGRRVSTTAYSEIDIEIVKASKYWPKSSYGDIENWPYDNALNGNVLITCTNWDLACREPENFNIGVEKVFYDNLDFDVHRWDDWYKALTIKYENAQDLTLGNIFYYEIEWKPEEIIWRIGKDKANMKVIGYMNSSNTKIPDNQMIAVVTQEFHYGLWWPTAPFTQDFIPFPKNDITGYIYDIEIE
ncbi:MAG: hypothetical protein K9H64_13625 [Bacteroidales bacterium]|nr:hypothetical protein [Bacteroidales bacterium]MCF8457053.1 hypothetical protein [Bacteroidales bacterium]